MKKCCEKIVYKAAQIARNGIDPHYISEDILELKNENKRKTKTVVRPKVHTRKVSNRVSHF